MEDQQRLVAALKRALRARGISYSQVAAALHLSEATIKRQFSRGGFTLERFQTICALADTTFHGLVRSQAWQDEAVIHLTVEQEHQIALDRRLLLVAICALSNFSLEAITCRYQVTKAEAIKLLLRLDQLEFLELLPENHIRLRVSPAFEWLPTGPVRQILGARLKSDYFECAFDRPGESLLVLNGDFPDETRGVLIAKIKDAIAECSAFHRFCYRTAHTQRAPQTLVLSVRPWELEEFRELRRSPPPSMENSLWMPTL